jgi:mono/diheme cytochrome c family protein
MVEGVCAMTGGRPIGKLAIATALSIMAIVGLLAPFTLRAAPAGPAGEVTFAKDIAPILQRSCQACHRPAGVAPMPLVTYEDVRPWARAIKQRTGIGPHAGVMPPWYMEKNIGIQHYKDDPSLNDEEVARIAKWADSGAPLGNPADMPPLRKFEDVNAWNIGTPDLIVKTKDVLVKANAPDWWGEIESVPVSIPDDRYVVALQVKEVNDIPKDGSGRSTVGGHYVFHHMIWSTRPAGPDGQVDTSPDIAFDQANTTSWPVHEVGRNADFFDPQGAPILRANSWVVSNSVHLHSGGRDTKAHLEIGFKLLPKDYSPKYKRSITRVLGNGVDIDIKPMEANQQLHAYTVLQENTKITTFEPHLHAPGMRMCLEAIWGFNIQTLSCAGYDHNWVRGYNYEDDYAPLLPKGAILHIIGYMDNSPTNKNIPDPRNWQGSGNRSIANMFIDLGQGVSLTDEQFQAEMAERRAKLHLTKNDVLIGCPLCLVTPSQPPARNTAGNP